MSFVTELPTLGSTDASMAYLSMIFGAVEGVLEGGGHQVAGRLFKLFSTIVLLFASVLWTYTTLVSIVNTASQGEFLGQKWSSIWIPIRVMLGFCLLIPKGTSGYSFIQCIVLSVALKGVAAANWAWTSTWDYLQSGGTIVESIPFFNKDSKEGQINGNSEYFKEAYLAEEHFIEIAGKVLEAQICTHLLDKTRTLEAYGFKPFPYVLRWTHTEKGQQPNRIQFPSSGRPGYCGTITWTMHKASDVLQDTYDFQQAAVKQMVSCLLPAAQRIADRVLSDPSTQLSSHTAKSSSDFHTATYVPLGSHATHLKHTLITSKEAFTLVNAARAMTNMLKVAWRAKEFKQQEQQAVKLKRVKEEGWLNAGMYYWYLAQMNKVNRISEVNWPEIESSIQVALPNNSKISHQLPKACREHFNDLLTTMLPQFIQDEKHNLGVYHQTPWIAQAVEDGPHDYLSDWVLKLLQSQTHIFQKSMKSVLHQEKDPILALSTVGKKLLSAVEKMWKEVFQHKIKFTGLVPQYKNEDKQLITSEVASNLVNFIALFPILSTWALLNFILGTLLVYYVPIIPFLLFFFGALNWFSLVITGVIAAPLVAVAVMSPEGHEIFGQAEQAIRLLAGLFLRPLLMIFGLIFGMILCTTIFEFFHYAYTTVLMEVLPQFQGVLSGVSQIAITTLYTTMAITIVSRCFSLIYELPNRVFGWIGWHAEAHSEAEILSQTRGGIDQYVGGASQQVTGQVVHPSHQHSDVTIRPASPISE